MKFLTPQRINTAMKDALAQQARITRLVQEIQKMDPYYADKSNARVIEDALKAWKHTIAVGQGENGRYLLMGGEDPE